MKTISTAAIVLIGEFLLLVNFAEAQSQWELERVIAPVEANQTEVSSWTLVTPLGKLFPNRPNQILIPGRTQNLNGTSSSHIVNTGAYGPELKLELPYFSNFELAVGWWNPGFALLKTPTGLQVAAKEYPWFLTFLDFPSGILVERKKPPLPGSGEAQQSQWTAIWNAGDINLDGFDDLFFQAHTIGVADAYTGLLDGASRTLLWRHYGVGSESALPLTADPTIGFSDLNGDGISDFVSGFIHGLPPFSYFSRQVTAFSGIDGAIIWERLLPEWGFDSGIWGRDLSGDGISDVITHASSQRIYALDGTTGTTLWTLDNLTALPLVPAGGVALLFANPVFFEEDDSSGTSTTVSTVIDVFFSGVSNPTQFILTIDGLTGSPLLVSSFPDTLSPWLPDSVAPHPHSDSYLVGDIDNDGYTEIASTIPTPSRDPQSWWPVGATSSLAIFGSPTIALPASLPLTQTDTAEFEIPSAPFMDLQLIISNEFNPRKGLEIDHWETNLAPSSLLTWCRGSNLTTTLDQDGIGSISFTLPNKPGLIGSELYFRGIVWDTAAGPGKVWTISSLGKATVAP